MRGKLDPSPRYTATSAQGPPRSPRWCVVMNVPTGQETPYVQYIDAQLEGMALEVGA